MVSEKAKIISLLKFKSTIWCVWIWYIIIWLKDAVIQLWRLIIINMTRLSHRNTISFFNVRKMTAVENDCSSNEPQHDKTNKVTVRPAKTQISLGIRPVYSESSLCAQWEAKDPRFLHADSEDSDQTGRMHTHFVDFVMSRLKCVFRTFISIQGWHKNCPSVHEKRINTQNYFFIYVFLAFFFFFFQLHVWLYRIYSNRICIVFAVLIRRQYQGTDVHILHWRVNLMSKPHLIWCPLLAQLSRRLIGELIV